MPCNPERSGRYHQCQYSRGNCRLSVRFLCANSGQNQLTENKSNGLMCNVFLAVEGRFGGLAEVPLSPISGPIPSLQRRSASSRFPRG